MEKLETTLRKAKKASEQLIQVADGTITSLLLEIAEEIEKSCDHILQANQKDCAQLSSFDPLYDRLLLSKTRLAAICGDLRQIADLPSPIGKELEKRQLVNGLELTKVSVPIGVVGAIFESRPNVIIDIFALCIKSLNSCVLKGGKEAIHTNMALVDIIRRILLSNEINPDVCTFLQPTKDEMLHFLKASDIVDVIIPRGSSSLINYVREHATVPVIETGAGIVHTYIDEFANPDIVTRIVFNAKMRRPSVCNALDTLIIHEKHLPLLSTLAEKFKEKEVILYADQQSYEVLHTCYPLELLFVATEQEYGVEFLSAKMAIKTVSHFEEAIEHIRRYSSRHSEAIISDNHHRVADFFRLVDAAVLYSNTSTAFTDGAQFGLGAEVGISTQKLHARGPMGVEALTTYKWIVEGSGQIRS